MWSLGKTRGPSVPPSEERGDRMSPCSTVFFVNDDEGDYFAAVTFKASPPSSCIKIKELLGVWSAHGQSRARLSSAALPGKGAALAGMAWAPASASITAKGASARTAGAPASASITAR